MDMTNMRTMKKRVNTRKQESHPKRTNRTWSMSRRIPLRTSPAEEGPRSNRRSRAHQSSSLRKEPAEEHEHDAHDVEEIRSWSVSNKRLGKEEKGKKIETIDVHEFSNSSDSEEDGGAGGPQGASPAVQKLHF